VIIDLQDHIALSHTGAECWSFCDVFDQGTAVTYLGLIALLFHGAFDRITQASFVYIIPHFGSPAAVQAYKWGLGALMLLPPCMMSMANPLCGPPCVAGNESTAAGLGIIVAGVAFLLTGLHHALDDRAG